MTEDKFQQLVQNHPDLFRKAGDVEFSIGDGWFIILNNLCGLISHKHESAKRRLKYALDNPDAKMNQSVNELEKIAAEEYEKLPTIVQVKEKFGGLRFYYDGGTEQVHNYTAFAESMAHDTCEVCGSPGKSRNDGWVKVLCDTHHRERQEKNMPGSYPTRKSNTETKLSDEN